MKCRRCCLEQGERTFPQPQHEPCEHLGAGPAAHRHSAPLSHTTATAPRTPRPHAAPSPPCRDKGSTASLVGGQGVGQLPPSPLVPRHYRQQPCLQPTTAAFSAGSQCSPVLLVTPPWAQARSAVGLTVWHTSGDAGEPELLHEASPWCEAQRAHPRALHCMQSVQWVAPPCAAGAPQSITHSSGAAG